jgi:hypothetical protein
MLNKNEYHGYYTINVSLDMHVVLDVLVLLVEVVAI